MRLKYRITKCYLILMIAPTGDVFLVYAKTGKGRAAGDVTSFLVEKGMAGFSCGQQVKEKCG